MDLLEICSACDGKGERWYYGKDSKELKVCNRCEGKGKVFLTKSHLIYKLEALNRNITDVWQTIKNRTLDVNDIWYRFSNIRRKCSKCEGKGEWYEKLSETKEVKKSCPNCNGEGKIYPTFKECYDHLFNEYFLKYKKEKEEVLIALNNEEYLNDEYQGFKPKYDYGSSWVCVKCEYFLEQCSTGGTPYCCNESMCTDRTGFKPINERAKQWYNNGGYKKNLNYNPKKDYRV